MSWRTRCWCVRHLKRVGVDGQFDRRGRRGCCEQRGLQDFRLFGNLGARLVGLNATGINARRFAHVDVEGERLVCHPRHGRGRLVKVEQHLFRRIAERRRHAGAALLSGFREHGSRRLAGRKVRRRLSGLRLGKQIVEAERLKRRIVVGERQVVRAAR